jgi:protein required for attachment to host cells
MGDGGDGEKVLFFRNEGDATYPNLEVIDVLNMRTLPTANKA